VSGTPADAKWVNFRETLAGPTGFVGDRPGDITNFFETESALAGTKLIGGVYIQGWGSGGPTGHAEDPVRAADSADSAHTAGENSVNTNASNRLFHIGNLVVGHQYKLWMSLGALNATGNTGRKIFTDATGPTDLLATTGGANIANMSFAGLTAASLTDINGGGPWTTAGAWWSGQTGLTFTAQFADLYFGRPDNFASSFINAIGIEDLSAVAAVASSPTFMLMRV
jgi:hypothetical protein